MKTIIQKDHFMCGPVAIRNAMVLLGEKPIGLKRLRKLCKTTSRKQGVPGTWISDMVKALRLLGFVVRHTNKRSSPKAVYIVSYCAEKPMRHLVAIKNNVVYNHWNMKKYVVKSKIKIRSIKTIEVAK